MAKKIKIKSLVSMEALSNWAFKSFIDKKEKLEIMNVEISSGKSRVDGEKIKIPDNAVFFVKIPEDNCLYDISGEKFTEYNVNGMKDVDLVDVALRISALTVLKDGSHNVAVMTKRYFTDLLLSNPSVILFLNMHLYERTTTEMNLFITISSEMDVSLPVSSRLINNISLIENVLCVTDKGKLICCTDEELLKDGPIKKNIVAKFLRK